MIEREFFKIPSDWEYRGEGNCHVVLGLPKLKKVLRIRKKDKPRSLIQWVFYLIGEYISWWYSNDFKVENRDLKFHLNVMRPLLGPRYVSDAKQVKLSRKQVKKIEYLLAKLRPDFRKHKVLHFKRATLFHDFTTLDIPNVPFEVTGNNFSIEIKPKKGWTSFSEKNFPECIFCMNQYIKLETKKISTRSSFCPKKLFSGIETEITESILSLIDNPQNNFRIFKNGHIMYDENSDKYVVEDIIKQMFEADSKDVKELKDEFCSILYKCLTRSFESELNCEAKLFCKWDEIIQGDSLPKGCILEKILSVQMLDVEGTKYYSKLMTDRISEWGYVKQLLNGLDKKMCVKCALLTMTNVTLDEKKDLLFAPYLIAAVANDCSLMITLKRIKDETLDKGSQETMKNVIISDFGSFIVNIGVFDLYPKPISTIKKHEVRNKKLLEVYHSLKT